MLFLTIILNILLTQVVYCLNWQHEIYVSTTTGINDTSCWTGGQHTPCATFNPALRGLHITPLSSTLLLATIYWNYHKTYTVKLKLDKNNHREIFWS